MRAAAGAEAGLQRAGRQHNNKRAARQPIGDEQVSSWVPRVHVVPHDLAEKSARAHVQGLRSAVAQRGEQEVPRAELRPAAQVVQRRSGVLAQGPRGGVQLRTDFAVEVVAAFLRRPLREAGALDAGGEAGGVLVVRHDMREREGDDRELEWPDVVPVWVQAGTDREGLAQRPRRRAFTAMCN